jgi:hypothetical protein
MRRSIHVGLANPIPTRQAAIDVGSELARKRSIELLMRDGQI